MVHLLVERISEGLFYRVAEPLLVGSRVRGSPPL